MNFYRFFYQKKIFFSYYKDPIRAIEMNKLHGIDMDEVKTDLTRDPFGMDFCGSQLMDIGEPLFVAQPGINRVF